MIESEEQYRELCQEQIVMDKALIEARRSPPPENIPPLLWAVMLQSLGNHIEMIDAELMEWEKLNIWKFGETL